jgi:hypothetical protein
MINQKYICIYHIYIYVNVCIFSILWITYPQVSGAVGQRTMDSSGNAHGAGRGSGTGGQAARWLDFVGIHLSW